MEHGEGSGRDRDGATADDASRPEDELGRLLEEATDDVGATQVAARTDVYVSGFLLLLTLGYIARAIIVFGPEAQQLPVATAIPAAVTLAALTFKAVRRKQATERVTLPAEEQDTAVAAPATSAGTERATEMVDTRQETVNSRWSLFWIAVALAVPLVFGFVVGFPILLLLYLRLRAGESWLFTLTYTVLFCVAVYVFFVGWVDIPPYEGLLDLEVL